ncbi:MAG: ATP-dependent DNA helicase [Verrucomicrobia bacterium]|nr:ATP-dependent DNA helicase [Verrucomicrobiota bacterium]MCF7708036.1 ATP-dependent DNA helicase [Verrucomicrobiota bacterium]
MKHDNSTTNGTSIPVRSLVEFVLKTGDLRTSGDFSSPTRAIDGIKGHRFIQNSRPGSYQKELTVAANVQCHDTGILIQGRIDGLIPDAECPLIEEIKTVSGVWNDEPDPLHWAQLKIYAHMYLIDNPADRARLRLVYLELETGMAYEYHQTHESTELAAFFNDVTNRYAQWLKRRNDWIIQRNASTFTLAFPFPKYRKGQRELSVAVYKTIRAGQRLFAEAPTGIGKTVSVIFPAVKALGKGLTDRIFYLTSKNTGKAAAEQTLDNLRSSGLKLKSLTLTAKENICPRNAAPCDASTCPFAAGYYDRLKPALEKALERDRFIKPDIETAALEFSLCPFEFSLDLSNWVDMIICDYNYAFDPQARLRRHFEEAKTDYTLLIDEAHNLPDRARDMFSAELTRAELRSLKRTVSKELPHCVKALSAVDRLFATLRKAADCEPARVWTSETPPEKLLPVLSRFTNTAEAWLAQNHQTEFRNELLNLYFKTVSMIRVLGSFNSSYVTIVESEPNGGRFRLFCRDPSSSLEAVLKKARSAVFFSATLSPPHYFKQILGADTSYPELRLPSPFPHDNLTVLIEQRISTNFTSREKTSDSVTRLICDTITARRGNYIAFFPSYKYLELILEKFQRVRDSRIEVIAQSPGMTDDERLEFLSKFDHEYNRTLVGFAVMGGIFGEAVDLTGERLIGAIIVGVGLPKICIERNLISEYFEKHTGHGFDYAYTFPGINRVLQACGRVIRSEKDRGIIVLIDNRFRQSRYLRLLPPWWRPEFLSKSHPIKETAIAFWESNKHSKP